MTSVDVYDVSLHCSSMKNNMDGMYHQQQNKWYPHGCFLAHFEDIYSIIDVTYLLEHYNLWLYYYRQVNSVRVK